MSGTQVLIHGKNTSVFFSLRVSVTKHNSKEDTDIIFSWQFSEIVKNYSTWRSFWCKLADYSHIFTVPAVVTSPPVMTARCDTFFITVTMDIVQPDLLWCSISLVPTTAMRTPSSLWIPQHATNHICFLNTPVVITNGSPCAIKKQFYSSLVRRRSRPQTNLQLWMKNKQIHISSRSRQCFYR